MKHTGDWEFVHGGGADHQTHRLQIPVGWLYRHTMRHDAGKDSYTTMSIYLCSGGGVW